MYTSFLPFAVTDERHLHDPERLRGVIRARGRGNLIAAAAMSAFSLVGLALLVFGLHVMASSPDSYRTTAWSMTAVGFFFFMMCVLMAAAFYREESRCALRACLKYPQQYEFVKGRIVDAVYSPGDKGRGRTLVKGEFEGGLFLEEFDPGVWSDAVAERGGDEGLKPGDDRYGQKGRRVKMPIEVWAVKKIGVRAPGALAGIPAETVKLLQRRA